MYGYIGKILMIDLTTGTSETIEINESIYENYLSGLGLGVYVLSKYMPAGADPLGEENILGMVSGILTGTGAVMSGRWLAVGKSPLTGGWGDANCGGTFAPAIKQCGFDGLFFKGISPKPVYVFIDNKGVQIRDAKDYWGLDAVKAEKRLIRDCRVKKKPEAAVIGTSGEKLSLISGITNDFGRIAARSGLGAVMGSKKLKAVVCAGSKSITCAKPEEMKALSKEYGTKIKNFNLPSVMGQFLGVTGLGMGMLKHSAPLDGMLTAGLLKRFGSGLNNKIALSNGDAPIKNWAGTPKDFSMIDSKNMKPSVIYKTETKKYHCYSCVIGCGGICDIKRASAGKFRHTHKPEYETVNSFGALLLNKDHESILYINELLNRAGMDSISAGSVVAFAIEAYEKGIISKDDFGGLDMSWGNSEAIIELIQMMIAREGIGDLLADGVKKAAQKLDKRAEEFAIHCGGQEAAMHDARLDPMLGVHFSADPTPGKHTTGAMLYYNSMFLWEDSEWAPRNKRHLKSDEYKPSDEEALKSVAMSAYKMILDGAGGCYYAMLTGNQHFKLQEQLNAATGWEKSLDDYLEIGKRIQTARQWFNIREGIDPKSFIMNKRMQGIPPLSSGPLKGKTVLIDEMVSLHWKHFGWDTKTGIPTEETLQKYGLIEGGTYER